MSYTALYRKFRPETFQDVCGQDAIVTTLSNQIQSGRIGHAYLFCGTRGTGKTSVAKIMARAVNCDHPTQYGPCGVCDVCRAIKEGRSMNVIEIDAASNNGVDNVREIRDEVTYAPTEGKYKVYIIDEVHMLSGSAFNALLKTLEEPPSYVIFILATTEPHKLPATILSRCQRYDFKRITLEVLTGRMAELTGREGVDVEPEALRFIGRVADGSMRDALSLLDQCIAFYLNQKLTYEKVLDALGAVDSSVFGKLYRAVNSGDTRGALDTVDDVVSRGKELTQFINDFAWYLRNLLLISANEGDAGDLPGMSTENLAQLQADASGAAPEKLMRYIRILSELGNEIKFSSQKRILTEIAIIKLCKPQMEVDTASLVLRIEELEKQLEKITAEGIRIQDKGEETRHEIPEAPPGKPELPMAVPEDVKRVAASFRNIVKDMEPIWQSMLVNCRLSLSGAGNLLMVFPDNDMGIDYFRRRKAELEEYISEKTGKRLHIEFEQLPDKQDFSNVFADLEDVIRMEIEIED